MIEGCIRFNNEHQVMIEAPKLEHLYIKDDTLVSYLVHELHSLCDAHIDINYSVEHDDPIQAGRVPQLLKKLTNLKSLYLSHSTIYALGVAYRYLYDAGQYFSSHVLQVVFFESEDSRIWMVDSSDHLQLFPKLGIFCLDNV